MPSCFKRAAAVRGPEGKHRIPGVVAVDVAWIGVVHGGVIVLARNQHDLKRMKKTVY